MRRSIALLLLAAALTQAAEVDPCDRQPFRGRCPNGNGAQTRSQFVLRYYMRNNECVSYPYGHCASDASEPQLFRYKEECEQACLAPGNLGVPLGDSFERLDTQTYGTVGPLDKAPLSPSTASPVSQTPLPTTLPPTTVVHSTTVSPSTTVRSTTPSTTTRTTETPKTECERRRSLASSSLIKGGFVPECDRNGNFVRTQCEPDARQCFCVDEDGIEVSNSRTRDGSRPDCDGIVGASPPRTNECVGIPETGPCSSNLVRWHYDEEALECKTFAYSGCGGNGNNYETEESCRERCVPVSVECPRGLPLRSTQGYYVNCAKQTCPGGYECHTIGAQAICCQQEKKSEVDNLRSNVAAGDVCGMPKERGPCDKYELRFFYNAETHECKYFFFGGCEGNGNNFARVEECEERCGVKKGSSVPVQTAPPTTLPPTTTPFRTASPTTRGRPIVTSPVTDQSSSSFEGDDFSSEEPAPLPTTETSRPTGERRDMAEGNRCVHPLDMGNCQGHFVRWFWNEQKGNCEVFTYTGCQGNGNNFASREECLSICNGEALARGGIAPTVAAVMNVCKHDVDAGECNGVFQRFAFNSEAGECRQFTYGGCGGNGNNFATLVECKQRCQQDTVSGDVCTSNVDSGECTGIFQRFAFDRAMGDCRPFNYGGCGGNGNNFATLGECRGQCEHLLSSGCSPRPACDLQRCQMLLDVRGCPFCSCPPNRDGVVPPVQQCPPIDPSRCVEPCTTFTNRLGCTECSCPREGQSVQPPPSIPLPSPTSPSTTSSPPPSTPRLTSPHASPPAPRHHSVSPPSPPSHSSAPSPPSSPSPPAPRTHSVTTHDTHDKPLPPPSHSSPPHSSHSPLPSTTKTPSIPDALGEKCLQPLDAGPCDRFIERFYFEAKDGRCHSFRYGGCAGNRNHFFSQKECEIHCARFSNFLSAQDPTLAMISRRLSENGDKSLPFMESLDTPSLPPTTTPLPLPRRTQGGPLTPQEVHPTFKPIPIEEIMQWAMEHEGPEATATPKGTKGTKTVPKTAPVTTTTTRGTPSTTRPVPTTTRPTVKTVKTTTHAAPSTPIRHEGKTRVNQSVEEVVRKESSTVEGVVRVPNPPRVIVPQDQTLPKEVFDRFIHDVDHFHHEFVKEKNGEIPPPFPPHHSHRTPMPSGTLHLIHIPDGNSALPPSHPLAPHIQRIMRVGQEMMRSNVRSAHLHKEKVVDITPLTEEEPLIEGNRQKGSRTRILAHPTAERASPLVPLPGRDEEEKKEKSPGVEVKRTSEEVLPLTHRPAPLRVRVRPIPKKETKKEEEKEIATTTVETTTEEEKKNEMNTHDSDQSTTHTTTVSTTHSVPSTTQKMERKSEKKDRKKGKKNEKIEKNEKTEKSQTEKPVATIPEMVSTTTMSTTTVITTTSTSMDEETETTDVYEDETEEKEAETTSDEDTDEPQTTTQVETTTEDTVTEDEEDEEEEEEYVVISESGEITDGTNSTMKSVKMNVTESTHSSTLTATSTTSLPSTVSSTTTLTSSVSPSSESSFSIENSTMTSSESEEELSEEDMESSEMLSEVETGLTPSNSSSNSSMSNEEVIDMASLLSSFTDLLSSPTNSTPQFTPPLPPSTDTVSLVDFLGGLSLDDHSTVFTPLPLPSSEETTPQPISVNEDTPRFLLPPPSQVEEIVNRFRPPDNLDIQLKSMNETITRESRHIDALPLPSVALPSSVPSVPSVANSLPSTPHTPPLTPPLASLSQHEHDHSSSDSPSVHVSPTKKLPLHRIVGGPTTPTPSPSPLPPHSAEEGTRPHESASPIHSAPEQAIQGGLEVNLNEVEDISRETLTETTTPPPNSISESSSSSPSTPSTESIPLPPSTFSPFPAAASTFEPVPTPASTFAPLPTPSVTLAPFPQPQPSLKEEKKEEKEEEKETTSFPVPSDMDTEYEEEDEEETDDSDVLPSTQQTDTTTETTTPVSTTPSTPAPLPVIPDGAGRQPVPDVPVGIAAVTEEIPLADPNAVCGLTAEAGPCFDYSPRWYYNAANSRCEQFSYGGCGGNGNNFAERKTCEVRCGSPSTGVSLLSQVPERCTLPKDVGTGGGFASKWFFSMASLRCEQFIFEGVGGNENQFPSLSDCERQCTPTDMTQEANLPVSEEDEDEDYETEGEDPSFGSDDPEGGIPPLTSVDDATNLEEKTPDVVPAVHASKTVQKNYHTDPIRSVVDVNGNELPLVAPSPPETVNYQTGHRAAGIRTFDQSNGRVNIENAENVDEEEDAPSHPPLPSCPNSAPELKYADGRPVMCLPGKNQCPDKSVCYFNGLDYFCCPEDEDPYDKHVFGGYNGEETKQGYKRFGHLNIRRLRDSVIDHSRRKRQAGEMGLFSLDPLRFDGAPIKQISSARPAKAIRRHPGSKRKTPCDYPIEKGECAEKHLRYFYDKSSDSCHIFHYSGCNGNANNFGSEKDCQEMCVKRVKDTAIETAAAQQKMASHLPPGTCPSGEPLGGSAPVLCGNTTESIGCPHGYFCRQGPPDVCCPNLSLNEILSASSTADVVVKETEQTKTLPTTTTTKAPQHYCPDASDPLLTKTRKIRTCGSGFDGLKMCPKGFYCAINADQGTRLCCPILGSSSRIPYQHGVIPPYFGKRNPNSGEVIERGSLPADQKTTLDEEETEMDKKAMDDFIVPSSPKGSSLERFIDEAEVKSEEEDEEMARMMIKSTRHQEEQKEVSDIILPSIESDSSPVVLSNVPTPTLESETTVLPKETFDRSRCQLRPDEGRPCREDEVAPRTNLHYFYSEVDGRCKLYFYKGCGGNENRFERKTDCETTCMA